MVKLIEGISGKESFLFFLRKLAEDYRENPTKWENKSVDEYLESIVSWVEDYSVCRLNDVNWHNIDYVTIAKILYMGKIYE